MMKKFALALMLVVLAAGAAGANDYGPTQDFVLHNMTGKTMVSMYVGPSGGSTWRSEDELGNYALAHGASVEINFEPWDYARYGTSSSSLRTAAGRNMTTSTCSPSPRSR